ncbi:MAG: hypothetical protein ACJ8EE_16205, partial [Bradyrhizobium sp.]
ARGRPRRFGATGASSFATGGVLLFCTISQKILDATYIMRDSIKSNTGPEHRAKRQGGTHGSVFFAARLLDGDPDRAV